MSLPEQGPTPAPRPNLGEQLFAMPNVFSGLKWGAIVGIAYFVVGLLISSFSLAAAGAGGDATRNPLLILPACLGLFTIVFALFVAGYLPAMERGQIAPGLTGAVAMLIVANVLQRIFSPSATAGTGGLGVQIVSLILAAALSVALGWLGAFYGVKRNTKTSAPAVPRAPSAPRA